MPKAALDEQKVRAVLGIGKSESIEEAVCALKERVEALEAESAALTDKVAALEKTAATGVSLTGFDELKGHNAQMTARLGELNAQLRARDCDDAVRKALEAGKIVPATEQWARGYFMSDPEGFARFIEAVPPVVAFTETGSGESREDQSPAEAFTERCGQIAAEKHIPFADAMVLCEKEEPELFEAYTKARQAG